MTADGDALTLGIDAVAVAVRAEQPLVLTVGHDPGPGLPSGDFRPHIDRTLELAARRILTQQTGIDRGYLEQLYTFGDRHRDPRERAGGPRQVSVGYLALVAAETTGAAAAPLAWSDWYRFFPWEDARQGRPDLLDREIIPRVRAWAQAGTAQRGLRARIAFGLDGAPWNEEAVLERYECLFEIGAVAEAAPAEAGYGEPMARDHRRILATAIGRLRGKIKYRPVVFELVGPAFTLSELQATVEALAGMRLHGPNFRRLVEEGGFVEGTGERRRTTGRPAEVFRFRPDVLAERPDPGIGIR